MTKRICLEVGNNRTGYCGLHIISRTYDLDRVTCKECLTIFRDIGKTQMERAKARLKTVREAEKSV